MKRTVKKLLAGSILTVFVFVCGIVSIVFFPEPLFAHKREYKQFRIYSDNPVGAAIENVLDNTLQLTQPSELYDSACRIDIFISFGNVFNTIDDKILGHGPSARATDNNIVLKVRIDPERNLAFPTFYDSCQADLTWLIAHEMVHCLQENRYGKVVFNPFNPPPMWKLEGYPEYVSRKPMRAQPNYDLKAEI